MKRNLEIVLKGKGTIELESNLVDEFGLEIVYNISDIEDVGSRKSNYTKSFKILGTTKNNKLFQHIYDINFESATFDMNARQECYIMLNKDVIIDGYLKLRRVTKKKIADKYQIVYEVNVYDEIKDIFSELGSKTLQDLDFSESYSYMGKSYDVGDHVYDVSTVKNSQFRNATTSNVYDYPVVNWNYNGINEGDKYPNLGEFDLSQFYPSVYVRAIVDKMFGDIGYTYESDFINGITYGSMFNQLATIYNGSTMYKDLVSYAEREQQWDLPQTVVNDYNSTDAPNEEDFVSAQVITHYGHETDKVYDGENGMVINGDGTYKFTFVYNYNENIPVSDETDLNSRIQLRIGEDVIYEDVLNDFTYTGEIRTITTEQKLSFGDVVTPYVVAGFRKSGADYLGTTLTLESWKLSSEIVLAEVENKVGDTLSLNSFLPNITQANFMKSLIKQFNLYIIPDKEVDKHVVIEPRRAFYQKGEVLDWTDKIGDDVIDIDPMNKKIKREYNYNMAKIDTLKGNKYIDKYNSTYGSFEIDLNNDDIVGKETIETEFGGYDFTLFTDDNTFLSIPNLVKTITDNMATKKREIAPAIGFMTTQSNGTYDWRFYGDEGGGTQWKTISHFNKFNNGADSFDVNFETKEDLGGYQGSYELFWQDGMNNLFNNNNRYITYYVQLDLEDVKNLDFKNVVTIKGELYYVMRVVTNIKSLEASKVELVKAFDYLKITTIPILPVLYGNVSTITPLAAGVGRPVVTTALLDTGFILNIPSDSYIELTPNSTLTDFFWFATPNQSIYNKKNSWLVDEYNKGGIGGTVDLGSNLFPDVEEFLYEGDSYNVYVANYQTDLTSIKLDYVEATPIS